ncbi:MAG: hypothetical protein RR581_08150 [Eubacterium sp.]
MEKKEVFIRNEQLGDPTPSMTFLFILIMMVFWSMFTGISSGPTELLLGCIQLALFPGYFVGSILYYMKGDTLNGTVFMIFGTVFGVLGGLTNIAVHFSNLYNWGVDPHISTIPLLWTSLTLIPIMVAYRKSPALIFLVYGLASAFLLIFSCWSLGWLPTGLAVIFKWIVLTITVGGLYVFSDGILKSAGDKGLPLGSPFFKK